MPKTIQVTGKWEGSVTMADPLTLPQARLIEEALDTPKKNEDGTVWLSAMDEKRLPALFGCVTEWNLKGLEGVTPENFPASPRKASHKLVEYLFLELMKIYTGELETPNA